MAQPSGEPTTSPTGAVAEPAARPGAWPAQWPLPARLQQVLNLAIPECYQHIRGQMLALLDEYEISYLKWDHNRDLIEAGDATRGGRPSVHAQTLACYRLMDELKEAHPELEIESCSSGGARVDLGIMERCDRVWVSDCIDPLERQQMNRWTMQLLPPELLGSHIASGRSHTTGRVHDLPFRAGTAMLGHLGVEWDLRTATTKELAELRDWIDYYRERRDHLLTGDLVRVDTDDTLNLYGIVSSDRRRATFFAATIGRSEVSPRPRLRFRGLDPDRRYRVRPVIVGQQPSGLEAPEWWTAPGELAEVGPLDPAHPYPPPQFSGRRCSGAVFTGAALARAGVASPMLHPEQIVLYELEAVHSDGD